MGIVTNADGFLFHDGLSSDCIVIEENRIDEYVDYINSKKITSTTVNSLYYHRKDVNFLEQCPNIEEVNINTDQIEEFSGLYHLRNLKMLLVGGAAGELDMVHFDKLEELGMGWTQNVQNLNKCRSLMNLRLRQYKPKSRNLEELFNLQRLKELVLTQSPITSLKGCRNFPAMEKLELNYIRTLEILDELEYNAGTMKHLRFDSCKKIKNHDYVTCLKELELLAFDDCGDIPSIGFIQKLPKLKSFIFTGATNVIDGDISPCVGLDYVAFANKKHYTHRFLRPDPKSHIVIFEKK